jgi:DNA-binding beta-propeller fold protein YncE
MAVVLTVAAIVFVSMLPNKASDTNLKIAVSVNRLDKVEEAMRGFMAANGRRPCPADASLAQSNAGWGKESINAGVCNITAGMMGPDTSGNLTAGLIPTRSLGIEDSYAFDEFGRPYTYVVDTRSTVNGTCKVLSSGGIQISTKNTAGAVTSTDYTMAAYISGGRSGFGTYLPGGSTTANRLNTGSTDADALANAGVSGGGASWTYTAGGAGTFSNVLVKKSPTTTFDQVVWYRPDLKNKCCMGSTCSGGGGASCTPPAGFSPSTLTSGSSYNAWQYLQDNSCLTNTLVCNNGTTTCNLNGGGTNDPNTYCLYSTPCTIPPACSTLAHLDSSFLPTSLNGMAPGNTASGYASTSDLTCTAHAVLCTSGTLTCDGSSAAYGNCKYSSCVKECACPAGWTCSGGGFSADGNVASGGTVTAYLNSTESYGSNGGSPTCTSSQTRTCTNGVWNGGSWAAGDTNQTCTVTGAPCTLSANQGGSTCPANGPCAGSFYSTNSAATCPPANTLSCGNTGNLTCSDGVSADCAYSTCTTSSGGGGGNVPTGTQYLYAVSSQTHSVFEYNLGGTMVGTFGTGNLNTPYAMTATSSNYFVIDQATNTIVVFDASGRYVTTYGSPGTGNGQFSFVAGSGLDGITIDGNGNLWVSDAGNARAQELTSSGTWLKTIPNASSATNTGQIAFDNSGNFWVACCTTWAQEYNTSGTDLQNKNVGTIEVTGVAFDPAGDMWIGTYNKFERYNSSGTLVLTIGAVPYQQVTADSNNNGYIPWPSTDNIKEYNQGGTLLTTFSHSPTGAQGAGSQVGNAVNTYIDGSGNINIAAIYITSPIGVQQFNSTGTYVTASICTSAGTGNGQCSNSVPDIRADTLGNIWVIDRVNNRMESFKSNLTYNSQFGSNGTGNGQFSNTVYNFTMDASNNLFVVDQGNNRVEKFNSSGVWQFTIPSSGCTGTVWPACPASSANGQFDTPTGVAVDGSGNIWVTDTNNNRVQKFNNTGVFQSTSGTLGTGNGQFNQPWGITIDGSGNFLVTDSGNCRVQKFNSSFTYQSQFGSCGINNYNFISPWGIRTDSGGNIWVTDNALDQVTKFSSSGTLLMQIAGSTPGRVYSPRAATVTSAPGDLYVVSHGSPSVVQEFTTSGTYVSTFVPSLTLAAPRDMATTPAGNLLVADYSNNRVAVFNSSGTLVSTIGSLGVGNNQFSGPAGVAVDSGGNIWVADQGNNRVQEFNSTGTFQKVMPNPATCSCGGGSPPTCANANHTNSCFYQPNSIAFDSTGNMWVSEALGERVSEFNPTGTWVNGLGSGYNGVTGSIGTAGAGNGQFANTTGVAVDAGNNVWVIDQGTVRAQEFSNAGVWQSQISMPASSTGGGINIDMNGNIWLADTTASAGHSVVREYNTGGTLLLTVGVLGSGNGQFEQPWGVVIGPSHYTGGGGGASCTQPWGGTLQSGYSIYAYSASSSVPPGSCPAANTLSCTNGTMTCTLNGGGTGVVGTDCAYGLCSAGCSLPWGGGIANGANATAYQNATESYLTNGNSAVCVNSQTRTCNNGTLTGSYTNQSCTVTNQPCNLPWGGTTADGTNVTAYQSATEAAAGSATCVNSQTRSCSNAVLSGTYTNQNCAVTCALTANQGGGVLCTDAANPACPAPKQSTGTEYTASSGASCPAHTLTCAAAGLSCSTGLMSDCTYNSCSTGSTAIWVADAGNSRVQQFNMSGVYQNQIGSNGTGNGQFLSPRGVAVDSSGNIWVSEGNKGLQKFNSTGTWLFATGGIGSGNGQFNVPNGMAVDTSNNVWVADTNNNRVQEFNSSGTFLMIVGSNGNGNGQLSGPTCVAIDTGGNVWVADSSNNRVEKFNSSGSFLLTTGSSGNGNGQFSNPKGIAVDSSNNNVWVTDLNNNRVEVFNSSGTFLRIVGGACGHSCSNGQFTLPSGVGVDSSGNAWVGDSGKHVQEFNNGGTYLSQFGSSGSGNGQFSGQQQVTIH